jgi:hypothetical protein
LAFGDRLPNESTVGDALKFTGRINKNLDVATPKIPIEIGQYPFETIKVTLIRLLNQDEIDIAFMSLPTLCKRPEQNGFADAVFLEYDSGAFGDVIFRFDWAIH